MKHRAKGSKIKYEHDMIQGLRRFLEKEIEPLEYVESIFPGAIKRTKGVKTKLKVQFKYKTNTGAKLIAYGLAAVQEVFVVTKNPEGLKDALGEAADRR